MHIGVTYDLRDDYRALGFSEEDSAEFDVEETIAAVCKALAALGHQVERIGNIKALTRELAAGARWDCVFNICEGVHGVAREAQAPALLEAFDIPYVFSDPLTLALALDKGLAKRVVRDAGVPVADFAVIADEGDIARVRLPFPLFLKPNSEGSGKGVDAHSRVTDTAGLERVARDLLRRFRQPVLVEEYLPGREFTVGILGTGAEARVLGVMEIVPGEGFVGHGYGLENKEQWIGKLTVHRATGPDAEAAAAVALSAWRALRCRDGGRCDIRQGADGGPRFIEVNPLAGIRPGYSDLCFIAEFEGMSYQQLIGGFMDAFLRRHPELALARAAQ
jgi:D-alanine-D-alanine ligase